MKYSLFCQKIKKLETNLATKVCILPIPETKKHLFNHYFTGFSSLILSQGSGSFATLILPASEEGASGHGGRDGRGERVAAEKKKE